MKNSISFLICVILFSCLRKVEKVNNCFYSIDQMFKKYDSSKLEITKYDSLTEVRDSDNITGEKGLYKFDENRVLRFYGFLLDKENNYHYGVEFDSLGNPLNTPKSNVVRWYINKMDNHRIRISFLLFDIKKRYGDVTLDISENIIKIPLFESKYFSNIIVGETIVILPQNKLVSLSGKMQDKCSNEIKIFTDTLLIPSFDSSGLKKGKLKLQRRGQQTAAYGLPTIPPISEAQGY